MTGSAECLLWKRGGGGSYWDGGGNIIGNRGDGVMRCADKSLSVASAITTF